MVLISAFLALIPLAWTQAILITATKIPTAADYEFWATCKIRSPTNCPVSWEPVCGITRTGLPRTYKNSCTACNNFGVIAYRNDTCEKVSFSCDKRFCGNIPIGKPSCAFQPNSTMQNVDSRVCCDTPNAPYKRVFMAPCPLATTRPKPLLPELLECDFLDLNVTRICRDYPAVVCAYFVGSVTPVGFRNGCNACKNSNVKGYTMESCEKDYVNPAVAEDDKYLYCNKLVVRCDPYIYDPVCAIPIFGLPVDARQPCEVCRNSSSYYAYVRGKCSAQVKYCPAQRANCRSSEVITSCAF